MLSARLTAVLTTAALAVAGLAPAAALAGKPVKDTSPELPATANAPVLPGKPYADEDGRKNR